MKFSKNIHNMAVLIEFLAGAGLAIFFHLVLHSPEVAYSIFGIGILLSLATYLLREDLEKTRHELIGQYHQAHEITFAIAQICDAECHSKAETMLSGIKRTIVQLQQGFIPLDETEFYLEGAKCSDHAIRRIKTVDPITNGWHIRGALVNYYQSNLRALERGVAITRIFVMNHDELGDPDSQKILLAQCHDGIEVRIAFREELPNASNMSGRDTNSSFDFAIYDEQLATEVFPQSGTYFGRKTSQAVNVDKFLRFYELIEHSSHGTAVENERIILASDAIKPAA
ncbi:MAG: hypothetical protein A2X83_13140 [Desulfuromonadales bacterium GWD2_54_10]|nr:MAG: hypothetical protein A2X83_13140 [Desulfuromonadales bacterium GWD2_54_10]